jgi:hypothetical protein
MFTFFFKLSSLLMRQRRFYLDIVLFDCDESEIVISSESQFYNRHRAKLNENLEATITQFPNLPSVTSSSSACRARCGSQERERRLIRKSKFSSEKIGMIFHLCANDTVIYRGRISNPSLDRSLATHRGSRWEIIRSASSGVGGENFSSGGTSGCVEGEGCATSSVG